MKKEHQYFVPICLYDRSIFAQKSSLKDFLEKYCTQSKTLFIICDNLYAYNKIIDKKFKNLEDAKSKANKRGSNVYKLLSNLITKLDLQDNVIIKYWAEISGKDEFIKIYHFFNEKYLSDSEFRIVIDKFIKNYFSNKKSLIGKIDSQIYNLEKKYILNEISMSIYITEKLGFNNELWEKLPIQGGSDPILEIYNSYKSELKTLLSKDHLEREINFIQDI